MNKKSYKEAVSAFEALGSYQDSNTKLFEAKYEYVIANKNSLDRTTHSYLTDLKANGYKDSANIYSALYKWTATLRAFNTSASNSTHISPKISRFCDYLHFEFELSGGVPGGSVTLTHTLYWPDGSVTNSAWNWENQRSGYTFGAEWSSGFIAPSAMATGTLTVQIFVASTGELIGQASVILT